MLYNDNNYKFKGGKNALSDWRKKPTEIEYWDEEVDSILAIDENGTTDLKGVRKNILNIYKDRTHNDRWFTITGVEIKKQDFIQYKDNITSIKYNHWQDGCFNYKNGRKRVVLHSRDIRRKEGPFNPKFINYSELMEDINSLVVNTPFMIYSSSIDKAEHVIKYTNPYHVYNLCLNFIIERYCLNLNRNGQSGIIMLEARGKKEDKQILRYLVNLLEQGNNFHQSEVFSCIKGIYFNPKWSKSNKNQLSYIQLELADLVSYPIHKYAKFEKKDQSFLCFENKFYNYPLINGYGLKIFPKKINHQNGGRPS